jgi:GT2 family glycosyltransferase
LTLSILIVNWNARELLRQCLRSIDAECRDLTPQIVVVDGGSFDGCAEMLAAEFPGVDFVQSAENIGFGRSNNLGFARVTGDLVLLLNPDTEIRPGAVHALISALQSLPNAGLVGARLLNSDFSLQHSVHALPRPVRQALDSEFLRKTLSRWSAWAPPANFAPSQPAAVEAVSGACMLLRSETFARIGGFSPAYFMYAEDIDLCLKVKRAGLKTYHVPGAEILHHSGASSSTQGSKFSAVMIREALHTYLRLNHGWLAAATYRIFSGAAGALRTLVWMPKLLVTRGAERSALQRAVSGSKAVLSWSVGLERWAYQYTPARSERAQPTIGASTKK